MGPVTGTAAMLAETEVPLRLTQDRHLQATVSALGWGGGGRIYTKKKKALIS